MSEDIAAIASRAASVGIERVHAVAWRDLDDPTAGGSELHANEILTRWAEAGLEVFLHCGAVRDRPPIVYRRGIEVRRFGGRFGSWVRAPRDLARHLDRDRDAVLEVWHGVNFLAPFWSRVPTVGIFHHVHTAQFHQVLPPGAAHLAAFLERRLYPKLYAHRPLIALSPSVRSEMIEVLGWRPGSVHVVEPGVADRYVPGPSGDRSLVPLVVAAGRFMPQKGFADAVDVLLAVKRTVPDLEAVLAGDGPEYAAVAAKVAAAGASDWLSLPGRVDDDALLALYQRAWVLLSASRREGWGMTVTEAGACETPAVVTDITGHREAVVDGETGVLAADTAGLAAALGSLLTDDERRVRMGKAAAVHAARHGWDATARRVFDVLADDAVTRFGR